MEKSTVLVSVAAPVEVLLLGILIDLHHDMNHTNHTCTQIYLPAKLYVFLSGQGLGSHMMGKARDFSGRRQKNVPATAFVDHF